MHAAPGWIQRPARHAGRSIPAPEVGAGHLPSARLGRAPDSQLFMAWVDALLEGRSALLSPLGAGLIVAIDMGITDSRSFSRLLGVEHALVLREIADLSGPDGLITVTGRHAKSLRTSLALSDRGALLLKEALPVHGAAQKAIRLPSRS